MAATKSVVEQALFYRSLIVAWEPTSPLLANQQEAAAKAREVLEAEIDPALIAKIAMAPIVYFAGRNNGVAEELTLKTNEITHKKSDFLEGTYAVHGVEEVMTAGRRGDRYRSLPGRDRAVQDDVRQRRRHEGHRPRRQKPSFPRSASPTWTAMRPCCNCWPAGTSWFTPAWPGDQPRQGQAGPQDRQRVYWVELRRP